jgi:hypothetical protein
MKRSYCFSGAELLALVAAVSVVASITGGLVASLRIRTSELCTPLPEDGTLMLPTQVADVYPAPEILQ